MWPFPNRRKDETKDWSLDAPGLAMFQLFSGGVIPTSSGEAVGPETAMRVPAACCAVRTIAETLASLPLRIYRRGAGNAREIDLEHPANAVLEQPAPWSSGYELRLALALDATKHGRALAFAVRGGGKVRELHRTPVGAMRVEIDRVSMEPRYVLTADGERSFGWQDVVDITPIPASIMGAAPLSLVQAAAEPIGLSTSMARHAGNLFRNGAKPGGVISLAGKLDPSALDRLRASIKDRFSGEKSGDTLILEQGGTWAQLALNSVDAQFLETWRHQTLEIARVFRLSPHLLGELERTTHANAEQLALQFVSYCLRPWTDLFEAAFSRVLLTPAERKTHFLDHDFADLEKGDLAGRLDALGKGVVNGVLTSDEARARENLPPTDGGKDLRVPLNSVVPGTARDVGNPADNAPREPSAGGGYPPRVVA